MSGYIAILDDRSGVPDEVATVTGVAHYGELLHRKRSLRNALKDMLQRAGATSIEILHSHSDLEQLASRVDDRLAQHRAVVLPTSIFAADSEAVAVFIGKLRYGDDALAVRAQGSTAQSPPLLAGPWSIVIGALVLARHRPWSDILADPTIGWRQVPNHGDLQDLSNREMLVDFLSNTFDARHFNSIENDTLTVTKRSRDAEKMRREFAFYQQLKGPLKLFFLEPLEFLDDNGAGSGYRTERLAVPDMAVQWIHRSFDSDAFGVFLEKIGTYFSLRPTRPSPDKTAAEALYLGKVSTRLAALADDPRAADARALLARIGPEGGLEGLASRFQVLWRRLAGARQRPREAVSHGDLCFSNILYSRHNRLMKFIDPRGAETPDQLYLDEYYDLAKLSHSVLGGYDFINHDLVELCLNRQLKVQMQLTFAAPVMLQDQFRSWLTATGFDLSMARLAEASLFLSMLPLHIDVPKKVVAFAMVAADILDRLERGSP